MDVLAIIGQALFGLYWLIMGINHFAQKQKMVEYANSKNLPSAGLAVAVTGILMLLGGLSILLGAYHFWGILLLVIFLIPTTLIMHAFWKSSPENKMMDRMHFMNNVAFLGALLVMWAMEYLPYSLL